jgi:hypothetical protein
MTSGLAGTPERYADGSYHAVRATGVASIVSDVDQEATRTPAPRSQPARLVRRPVAGIQCWVVQRGSGPAYSVTTPSTPTEKITLDTLIDRSANDGISV